MFIHTSNTNKQYTEAAIRDMYLNTSFSNPFAPPEGFAVVFPSPKPEHNSIVERVEEGTPVLTDKGHYEQTWKVVPIYTTQKEADEALAAHAAVELLTLRKSMKQRITGLRWEHETGGITFATGVRIDTSEYDQNRITSIIANAESAGISSVDFKAATGWLTLTVKELKGIASTIVRHVQACFSAERAHHETIDSLTTSGLRSYDVNANWPN